jgi:hypothetical protein
MKKVCCQILTKKKVFITSSTGNGRGEQLPAIPSDPHISGTGSKADPPPGGHLVSVSPNFFVLADKKAI